MEALIKVEGIKIWARHGVYASEQVSGRYFLVDIWVKATLDEKEILLDKLESTVNYENLHRIVQEQMSVPVALLEKLAVEIIHSVKQTDPRINKVGVKVMKLNPPLGAEVAATVVEIEM